jgi:phosphatidate cytidylyltransferase
VLSQRILGGAIVAVVFLIPLFVGYWLMALLVFLLATLAVYELGQLIEKLGYRPVYVASIGLTALIIIDTAARSPRIPLVDIAITLGVLGTLVWLMFRAEDFGRAIIEWGLTLIGPFYLGWTLAHFVLLRDLSNGATSTTLPWSFWPAAGILWAGTALFGTWASDVGAYFTGRFLGRHKLYPRISPAKTWEGVYGGTALSVIVLGLLFYFAPGWGLVNEPTGGPPLWVHGIILGFLVSGSGILGDLCESFIKRGTGVKDASQLIPGHGGLLDRLDSLVFSVPVVYYYLVYVMANWLPAVPPS